MCYGWLDKIVLRQALLATRLNSSLIAYYGPEYISEIHLGDHYERRKTETLEEAYRYFDQRPTYWLGNSRTTSSKRLDLN